MNEGTSQQIYSCFVITDFSHSQTCNYAEINMSIVLKKWCGLHKEFFLELNILNFLLIT
jgi:hypothetical protein